MRSITYSLKKHLHFTSTEILQFMITVVLGGFFLSFNNWGDQVVDVSAGVQNMLLMICVVFFFLGLGVFVAKLVGVGFGYTTEYRFSWVGLVVGFFITFVSNGAFPFFLPGGLQYELISTRRIGKFRQFFNESELFVVASMPVVVPLLLAVPFASLFVGSGLEAYKLITYAGILLCVYGLIPVPRMLKPSDWVLHGLTDLKLYKKLHGGVFGYDLFCFKRVAFGFLLLICLIYIGLMLLFNSYSIFLAFVLALLIVWVYRISINYLRK